MRGISQRKVEQDMSKAENKEAAVSSEVLSMDELGQIAGGAATSGGPGYLVDQGVTTSGGAGYLVDAGGTVGVGRIK